VSALELLEENGESWRAISRVDGLLAFYYPFSLYFYLSLSLSLSGRLSLARSVYVFIFIE